MASVPTSPVAPGDEEYSALYQQWLGAGQPGLLENLAEGWLRYTVRPDDEVTEPTFLLLCSHTDYHRYMTNHSSWRRHQSLPKGEV